MEKRYQKYKGQNYQQYLVIQDGTTGPANSTLCKQVRDDYNLTFPVLYDPTNKLHSKYKLGVNEGNLVIGEGSVLLKNQKYANQSTIDAAIAAELAK